MKRLGVVGLGLIGGSLALAARRAFPDCEIVGADMAPGPWPDGLVDQFFGMRDAVHLPTLPRCDLLVLAVPVRGIEALAAAALANADVVTDVGSTKRRIADVVRQNGEGGRFVPGHPMAGSPRNGLQHADPGLFEGANWFVCAEHAEPSALRRVRALIEGVGARVWETTPEDHDRAVALTSHAVQVIASALAVRGAGLREFQGPAFERMTRGAGGDPEMWLDVLSTNRDFVGFHLRELAAQLVEMTDQLTRDPESLRALLDAAREISSDD